MQLHGRGRLLPVEGAGGAVEPVPLGPPPAGQPDADGVRARPHQCGHVGGLVHQPVLIGRPAGLEHGVVDVLAVDLDLVDTVCGRVERGADHVAGQVELDAQQAGRRGLHGIGEAHVGGGPLAVGQEGAAHRDGLAPGRHRSVRARDPHLQGVPGVRRERFERPGHEPRLVGVQAERGPAVEPHLGGGLPPAGHVRLHGPAQPWVGDVGEGAVGAALHAHLADTGGVGLHRVAPLSP